MSTHAKLSALAAGALAVKMICRRRNAELVGTIQCWYEFPMVPYDQEEDGQKKRKMRATSLEDAYKIYKLMLNNQLEAHPDFGPEPQPATSGPAYRARKFIDSYHEKMEDGQRKVRQYYEMTTQFAPATSF